MEESADPPFTEIYKSLITNYTLNDAQTKINCADLEDCELPLIDLNEIEQESCKRDIAKAAREWGFFQVVNHGISYELFDKMRSEQMKLFNKPFSDKVNSDYFLASSYEWGTPTATCIQQLSWWETLRVPLNTNSSIIHGLEADVISSTLEKFAKEMSELAHKLVEILAEKLGEKSNFFKETCLPSTCFVRMNRYPPCLISGQVFGLVPHTDSAFVTVLCQDHIGGLQLVKDGKWFAVKPRPEALIINIGDLFQAWSNDVYKSVEHRVISNMVKERFSVAFFMCPSSGTQVKSCIEPSVYRSFTFGEYQKQVQEDVIKFGRKIGLSTFLR